MCLSRRCGERALRRPGLNAYGKLPPAAGRRHHAAHALQQPVPVVCHGAGTFTTPVQVHVGGVVAGGIARGHHTAGWKAGSVAVVGYAGASTTPSEGDINRQSGFQPEGARD